MCNCVSLLVRVRKAALINEKSQRGDRMRRGYEEFLEGDGEEVAAGVKEING